MITLSPGIPIFTGCVGRDTSFERIEPIRPNRIAEGPGQRDGGKSRKNRVFDIFRAFLEKSCLISGINARKW